jgi:signal transduction histidine kinase
MGWGTARGDLAANGRETALLVPLCDSDGSQHEQVLALARLLISLVSFPTLWLDLSLWQSYEPARLILLFYLLYSLLILILVVRSRRLSGGGVRKLPDRPLILTGVFQGRPLPTSLLILFHLSDMVWPALICLLTGGANSPFFFLFVFPLMASTYRWGARGTLATGGGSVLIVLSEALLVNSPVIARFHFAGGPFLWDAAITNATSLVVLVGLLSFLADGERRPTGASAAANPIVENLSSEPGVQEDLTAAERRRTARDLHDWVIQSLVALEIEVDLLRRQNAGHAIDAAETLATVQGLIRQEVRNVRELIEQLRSDSLDSQLLSCLAEMVVKFQCETGITANLSCDVQDELVRPSVAHEVAGIVQEALSNIRKHSSGHHVEVGLASSEGWWQLVVQDDGQGFDFSGRLSQEQLEFAHKGPRVIQERVRSINGELTIESYPNRGARLEVRFGAYG